MNTHIQTAQTGDEILRCYPVLRELRPHLAEAGFLAQVKRQMAQGYRLAFLLADDTVQSVAGYRIGECLAWGKFLYLDDLVTRDEARSHGYGRELLQWLVAEARNNACQELHLDSGVQRFDAHRFYLCQRLQITCHHFAMKVPVEL